MAGLGKPGFWGAMFGQTASSSEGDRFTLEELRRLHAVLTEEKTVTDSNRQLVVETLRSLAELMIWGDQHDTRFFDFFAEKHLLSHFNRILRQPANRRGEVPQQVLQTLSILIQNIRSETAIFYLFSNNYINELITTKLDFDDDEVIGYYINLLKAISLKFTKTTVQFFFDTSDTGEADTFPLYTESIKFIRHRDGMVRSAVRALTLNVYSIEDPKVQTFVCSRPAASYFQELAISLVEQCQRLEQSLADVQEGRSTAEHPIEAALAEVEDLLSYCNDIIATGVTRLVRIVLEALWAKVVGPVLLWPLLSHRGTTPVWAAAGSRSQRSNSGAGASAAAAAAAASAADPPAPVRRATSTQLPSGDKGAVSATAALLVLERLLLVISERALLRPVLVALLAGGRADLVTATAANMPAWASAGALLRAQDSQSLDYGRQLAAGSADGEEDDEDVLGTGDGSPFFLARHARRVLQLPPSAYRAAFLAILRGGDALAASAAARVLLALLMCRHADSALLDAAGLLPFKRRKQRDLLDALTAPQPASRLAMRSSDMFDSGGSRDSPGLQFRHASANQAAVSSLVPDEAQQSLRSASAAAVQWSGMVQRSPSPSPQANGLAADHSGASTPSVSTPRDGEQRWQPFGDPAQRSSAYAAQNAEVLNALCGLLALSTMPVSALWTVGWLLLQLVAPSGGTAGSGPSSVSSRGGGADAPDSSGGGAAAAPKSVRSGSSAVGWGASLSSHQREVLSRAWGAARDAVMDQMGGMWCDALPLLIQMEWQKARAGLRTIGNNSTTAAVSAWTQAVQAAQVATGAPEARSGGATVARRSSGQKVSVSAASARLLWQVALRFVTLTQLQQALSSSNGEIPASPGIQQIEEVTQRATEIKEGMEVELTSRVSCAVAFARGVERNVYFAMEGRPAAEPGSDAPSAAAVVRAVPVVLLADQGTRLNSGIVLSVAPLMGADPTIDPSHKRWLHIHVRPPVRGLLKVLRASTVASTHRNLGRQLVDGHWVLSFPDAEAAHAARDLVDQHQAKLRASYCDALAPLLLPDDDVSS